MLNFISCTWLPVLIAMVFVAIFLFIVKIVKHIEGSLEYAIAVVTVDGLILGIYMFSILTIGVVDLLKFLLGVII